MIRGACSLAFLSLLSVVHCTRQNSHAKLVGEHTTDSQSVPKVIYDALRDAGAVVQKHVDLLEEANKAAEQKKEASKAKIQERVKTMKDMQAKTDQIGAKAKATRDLMIKVEKAAAEHSKAGEDHKNSMTKFGKLSDDLEALAKKITLKEQALQQVVSTYKRDIAKMKEALDKLKEEKDKAETEMKDLKTQAMSAGKFKTGVQQEQAKADKEMQTAQQELSAIRSSLETAVSACTVAEAQEAEAVNEAREANGRVEQAKKTKDYLMKIRTAVRAYYGSIDNLEDAVGEKAGVALKDLGESRTTLEKYNGMISAFRDLHAYDASVYQQVTPAIKEVKDNGFAQIRFICETVGAASSGQEHCLTPLWRMLTISKLDFPQD